MNLLEPIESKQAIVEASYPTNDQKEVVGQKDTSIVDVNYRDRVPDPNSNIQAVKPEVEVNPDLPYGGMLMPDRPRGPKFSTANENSVRETAKATAIGNALSLIADTAGVAMGGTVQKRGAKPLEPYLQDILSRRERFETEKGKFEQTDFLNQLRMAREATRKAEDERDFDEGVRKFDTTQEFKEGGFEADEAYRAFLKGSKLKDSAFNREKFGELKRRNAELERQGRERLRISEKAATTKLNKPFMKVNVEGQDVNLTEGEYRANLEAALKAEGEGADDIKTILARYSHQPTEEYKQIVQRYLSDQAAINKDMGTSKLPGLGGKTVTLPGLR